MHKSNPLLHQCLTYGSVGYSSDEQSIWAELRSVKLRECGTLPWWFTPPCLMHICSSTLCYRCNYLTKPSVSSFPLQSGTDSPLFISLLCCLAIAHLLIYLHPALHFGGASLVNNPTASEDVCYLPHKRRKEVRQRGVKCIRFLIWWLFFITKRPC